MKCESGWTGDRCTFDLFHEGPHSNEEALSPYFDHADAPPWLRGEEGIDSGAEACYNGSTGTPPALGKESEMTTTGITDCANCGAGGSTPHWVGCPNHPKATPVGKPEGGDMVQVGIAKNGKPVSTWDDAEAAVRAIGLGIEAFEVVDEGVYIVGMPEALCWQLEQVGWLRFESANGVYVITAEMS